MSKVNLGPKYEHRITLRVNDEQYAYLIKISNILGVTPSDYLRMSINTGMVASGSTLDELANGQILKGAVGTHENVKTDIDDIV